MLAVTIVIAVATGVAAIAACLQVAVYRRQLAVYQQQAQIAKRSLKAALYERRLQVFLAVAKNLATAVREGDMPIKDSFELLRNTAEADFLFPPEIREYVDDAYHRGIDLSSGRRRLDSDKLPAGTPEREQAVERDRETLEWFSRELVTAREKFLPYLDFTDL